MMKIRLISILAILMILLSSLCAQAEFTACFRDARIYNVKEYATLRSRPSPKAPALRKLYLGDRVTIISREAYKADDMDFVCVETKDYEVGYVWLNCIQATGFEYDEYNQRDIGYGYLISSEGLHSNLRTGPGTNYPAIGYLFGGEAAPYLGRYEKDRSGRVWYCCRVDDMVCWISSKVVDLRH